MSLNIGIKGIFILRHFLLGVRDKIADGGIVTVERTLEIFMIMVMLDRRCDMGYHSVVRQNVRLSI